MTLRDLEQVWTALEHAERQVKGAALGRELYQARVLVAGWRAEILDKGVCPSCGESTPIPCGNCGTGLLEAANFGQHRAAEEVKP